MCEERTTILSRVGQARGSYKEIYFQREMQEGKSECRAVSAGRTNATPRNGLKKQNLSHRHNTLPIKWDFSITGGNNYPGLLLAHLNSVICITLLQRGHLKAGRGRCFTSAIMTRRISCTSVSNFFAFPWRKP